MLLVSRLINFFLSERWNKQMPKESLTHFLCAFMLPTSWKSADFVSNFTLAPTSGLFLGREEWVTTKELTESTDELKLKTGARMHSSPIHQNNFGPFSSRDSLLFRALLHCSPTENATHWSWRFSSWRLRGSETVNTDSWAVAGGRREINAWTRHCFSLAKNGLTELDTATSLNDLKWKKEEAQTTWHGWTEAEEARW